MSPVLVSPVTAQDSVFNESARPLSPAHTTSVAARTSSLPAPQIAPAQLQPALETCSFLVPAPTGTDPIAHLTDITGTVMSLASDINTFIEGCQFKTLADPPSSSHHPAQPLLQFLATSGFPAAVGKPWYLAVISSAIKKGPHTSTRNSAYTILCQKELADRVSRGFSLLLTAEAAILHSGRRLQISCLVSMSQANQKDRLICDSTAPPPSGDSHVLPSSEDTPAVNVSTNRSLVPQVMQFGPYIARIVQHIWERTPKMYLSIFPSGTSVPPLPIVPSALQTLAPSPMWSHLYAPSNNIY